MFFWPTRKQLVQGRKVDDLVRRLKRTKREKARRSLLVTLIELYLNDELGRLSRRLSWDQKKTIMSSVAEAAPLSVDVLKTLLERHTAYQNMYSWAIEFFARDVLLAVRPLWEYRGRVLIY